MGATLLPTENRAISMDPELASEVEKLLKPLKGKDLEAARVAVGKVHRSPVSGSFGEILAAYKEAIDEAVKAA